MNLELLSGFLPMDRRHALAAGRSLPDRADGAVLFADIAGFTPLTESLVRSSGPRRGAEEVTRLLDAVYDGLISRVHRYAGSIISFSGDGLLCWFDADTGLRAGAAALAMQEIMKSHQNVAIPGGTASLRLKVAMATGPVRRFLVGDPEILVFEVLAGTTIDCLMGACEAASAGEVVLHETVALRASNAILLRGAHDRASILDRLLDEPDPAPWPQLEEGSLSQTVARPYVPTPVFERILRGHDAFLAELRPVVAMFVRCGGIDYDHDEDAGVKLDGYIRWAQTVLERCGGHLLQLTTGDKGTCLYAAFGALGAHEDDAERAVTAAAELVEPPLPLGFVTDVKIGISRGATRVGTSGSRTRCTFAAMGDEVNVAARLMQATQPGGILCSGRIAHRLKGRWAFVEMAPISVKGKENPITTYRPCGRGLAGRTGFSRILVGRSVELATLVDACREARHGRRHIVLIEGEPGIGKSRLTEEFQREVSELGVGFLAGAGHSIEYAMPYRAWREVLESLLVPGGCTTREAAQERVLEWVHTRAPALAGRASLLNDVLHLGIPESDLTRSLDPKLRHETLTSLIVDLLRGALASRPQVIVLDDAHWLDSLSWDLALSVARSLLDQPLLLVVALRPPEGPALEAYAGLLRLEGTVRLVLEGLPPGECCRLAAACLGVDRHDLPQDLADLIADRGGGNPFFVEELVKALGEQTDAAPNGMSGVHRAHRALPTDQVPDTLEGLLLARIDRLPPEAQMTLKIASVIGRRFAVRTLRDVHPFTLNEETLRAHLGDCERRDLTRTDTLEPEPVHRFKHAITQQVAYDTMLFAQRRGLHQRIATWFEDAHSDNLTPCASLLAYHWSRAEHWERECFYARRAGEQAAAVFANQEALRFLNRAIELTDPDNLTGRYELLSMRVGVLGRLGNRAAQAADIAKLNEVAHALSEPAKQAQAALRAVEFGLAVSDLAAAMEASRQALEYAEECGDGALAAESFLLQGIVSLRRTEWDTARAKLQNALEIAKPLGLRKVQAGALMNLGVVAWSLGDYTRAIAYDTDGLNAFREAKDRPGEGTASSNLGIAFLNLGNYDQALSHGNDAVRIAREIGDRAGELLALNNVAITAYMRGEYEEARAHFVRVLRIAREIGDRRGEGYALTNLGCVASDLGDYAAAGAFHEEALRISRETGDQIPESSRLFNLGEVLLQLGDDEGAQSCFEQGLKVSRHASCPESEGFCLTGLGLLLQKRGDAQTSLSYHEHALRLSKQLGHRRLQAYALTRIGLVRLGQGCSLEAVELLTEAARLRHDLGERTLEMESIAGLAAAHLHLGQAGQARLHVQEIMEFVAGARGARTPAHPLDGADDPIAVLLVCHRVLQALQDPRARDLVDEGFSLLQHRSARIGDESMRMRYREGISSHREIIALQAEGKKHGGEELDRSCASASG